MLIAYYNSVIHTFYYYNYMYIKTIRGLLYVHFSYLRLYLESNNRQCVNIGYPSSFFSVHIYDPSAKKKTPTKNNAKPQQKTMQNKTKQTCTSKTGMCIVNRYPLSSICFPELTIVLISSPEMTSSGVGR